MSLANVLDRAAAGARISFDEGVRLYREAPLHDLGSAAHARRMAMYPANDVTYVVDTTINTNLTVDPTFGYPTSYGQLQVPRSYDLIFALTW